MMSLISYEQNGVGYDVIVIQMNRTVGYDVIDILWTER